MHTDSVFGVRVFQGTAVSALLLLCAAPVCTADPGGWVTNRGPIACKWMDMHPNLYGAMSTMRTMEDEGVPNQEIPATLASVIGTYCPQHRDLYEKARDYLTHMGNPGHPGI